MWLKTLFLLIVLSSWVSTLHAYIDPGAFGTVSQIIFIILNVLLLAIATFFKSIKSLIHKIKRFFIK
jgi:hypothetical protein